MIRRVPSQLLPDLWPVIRPYAERFSRYHHFLETDDVLEVLLAGRGQLFVQIENGKVMGFAALEVVQYPRRRVAQVFAYGGAPGFVRSSVAEGLEELKRWAVEQAADTLAVEGRPGWKKVLRAAGGESLSCVSWALRLGDNGERRRHPDDIG